MPALTFFVLLVVTMWTTKALNPAIKLAGQGMGLLKPIFSAEAKIQAAVLGGGVDREDVKQELNDCLDAKKTPAVIYTYGLSPFSTEALAVLESTGAKFEKRELGPEWFLLGGRASVLRAELDEMTGQSSLPHIFIGGESIGGLSTGTPGLAALLESGELEAKLKKAKALK
jgi:glutaredoxin-related protein